MSKMAKGRMTSADRDFKRSQAKDLFIKGFGLTNISEILNVGAKTLSGWKGLDEWDQEKELFNIRPSEIKKMILKYVQEIKDGKKPTYRADDISKISAAFDRFNDNRKKAVYTMESIDGFSGFMMAMAGSSTGKKRDQLMALLKEIRPYFDMYVSELLKDD